MRLSKQIVLTYSMVALMSLLMGCKGDGGSGGTTLAPTPDNGSAPTTPTTPLDELPPLPDNAPIAGDPNPEIVPEPPVIPPGPACAGHPVVGSWVNENDATQVITFTQDCEGSSSICGYEFSHWFQSNQNASGSNIIVSVPEPYWHSTTSNVFPCIPFNGVVKQYQNFGIHFFTPTRIQMNVDYSGAKIFVRF